MEQQTIHLFVFDTLSDWEPGYAIAGINHPAFSKSPERFRVMTVGARKEPVRTMGGVTILPDLALEELTPARSAMLILPGGDVWDEGGNTETLETIRQFADAGTPLPAICGGTAGLARAGVLDTRKHTSNAPQYLEATGYKGASLYENQPAVTDGNIITAGATAPVDFAYHIFQLLGVYEKPILDAWYGLFKTGDPKYFATLQQLMSG